MRKQLYLVRVRTQLYLVRVQAARASVSPPWISLDYSVSSFIFLKLHAMFLKKFIASTCQSLTRKLFSTPRACRKPDVGVVRTTTNRRPSLLSCFELMSSNLPNNKANQPITLTCFFTFSLATNQSHATIQVTIHVTIKIFLLNYGMTCKHQNF